MKPTRNLYGIHNDFCGVGGGLRRGCILIRNRDGDDNVQVRSKTDLSIDKTKGWGMITYRPGARQT